MTTLYIKNVQRHIDVIINWNPKTAERKRPAFKTDKELSTEFHWDSLASPAYDSEQNSFFFALTKNPFNVTVGKMEHLKILRGQ